MANVSHAASGNVWTRTGHEREGYAWCASLSIDAACTSKVKGGTGVWFYHGGTEDEGTRSGITSRRPEPEHFYPCGQPALALAWAVRAGRACRTVQLLPVQGAPVAAKPV